MQDYRRLRVWRRAHAHLLNVRRATNRFPHTGFATTKSQLLKTAESVPFTLVEGCGAFTQKEMARFVEMSIKSTKELEYQLFVARDYGILPPDDWKSLSAETVEIRKMLCVLRRRILGDDGQIDA
jgi:four helix bundle protein